MRKKIFAVALALSMSMSFPALADGWYRDTLGWKYHRTNGSFVQDGWIQDNDGLWYCFDKEGYMLADRISPDGYWLSASGAWVPGKVVYMDAYTVIDGDNAVKYENGRYYLRPLASDFLLGIYFDENTEVVDNYNKVPYYKQGINGKQWFEELYYNEIDTVNGVYEIEVQDGHVNVVRGLSWWD